LLHALSRTYADSATEVFAVTVDHGLRPEAIREARHVAEIARQLGVSHDVLTWDGWDGSGNLQDRARGARYNLLTAWARQMGIAVLALGHTADDQAETVLMRLARSSGVNGLAGIPRRRTVQGITVVRPFLDVSRAQLRGYLTRHGVAWIDDPSNEDTRFERVRMREAMPTLASLGLTSTVLADVARNMSRAREALDWYTFIVAREIVQLDGGDVLIDLRRFRTMPEETARRLLVRALLWIGGGTYGPRRQTVMDAIIAIRAGKTTTLHGCIVISHGGLIWICREYNAVRQLESPADAIWDRRWRLVHGGPMPVDWRLRPLGRAGLRQCGDWRRTGRPYAALTASPSVWAGDKVLAAPQTGLDSSLKIELIGGGEEFFASILSH